MSARFDPLLTQIVLLIQLNRLSLDRLLLLLMQLVPVWAASVTCGIPVAIQEDCLVLWVAHLV